MIIFYCKKCAGKPYFTKEDARPRDERCPVCGGYLEERAVTQEKLGEFTPFNLMGKRDFSVNRKSQKNERQKPNKDVEKRKETISEVEPRHVGISTASAVARSGEKITNVTNSEEASSEKQDAEHILPEYELLKRNVFMNRVGNEQEPQEFKNTVRTRSRRPGNNGVIGNESTDWGRSEAENGAHKSQHMAVVTPRQLGRVPHSIILNGSIKISGIQQETVYRGTVKKIWDWLRYRQSFSDIFNTVPLQELESEYLDSREIDAVFYGQPISLTSAFGGGEPVRIRGYYDKKEKRVFIRRMANQKRPANLILQRSEEDRAAIRGLIYFILIIAVLLIIILNRGTILGLATSFLNFLKVFAVATLISGVIVSYATRNNSNLRFRDKVMISVACGVIFGALFFLA